MRYIMQDKHVVVFRANEDRNVFINKIKYPKTVYQIRDKGTPEKNDIVVDSKQSLDWIIAQHIIDNYDNLPDYTIFSQAIPDDHVHEMLYAIDSTFTGGYGSFAYARSMYNQWTTNWNKCLPVRLVAHMLGIGFDNDDNASKFIYYCQPGVIFYLSKEKILEKPKSFYSNIVLCDDDKKLLEILKDYDYPDYFWSDMNKYFPNLRNFSKLDKLKERVGSFEKREIVFGLCNEALYFLLFADKNIFDTINKAQACIGNKLYCDPSKNSYDPNYKFFQFPFAPSTAETILNFKKLENDIFDWNCPYYLKWREKLIEKTIWEGQQRGFDGLQYIKFLEQSGVKHITL